MISRVLHCGSVIVFNCGSVIVFTAGQSQFLNVCINKVNVVIKHDGHLRTRGKCRQHEPQASVFYISRVLSNVKSVLSQFNTRLRLLHLLYDIEVMWRKTIKHAFSMFYTLTKHGFLPIRARVVSYLYYN